MKTDVALFTDKLSKNKVLIRKYLHSMPWNHEYHITYDGDNKEVLSFFNVVCVGDVIRIDDFFMKVDYKSGIKIKGDKL